MNRPKRFSGFPARTGFTPIPNPFFSAVLPEIQDVSELRVTLHMFWALYRKKGYPSFVTYGELRGDQSLVASLSSEEELRHALELGVGRGTLLCLKMDKEGEPEELYFLNTEPSRRAIVQIENGEISLGRMVRVETAATEERRNIFTLYEQNIGLLTPLIAEDLKEAEKLYPVSWIEDAFRESVRINKRNWRYISKILEQWASRGKDYGTIREGTEKDISPKEYIQKYRHLTRR